MIKMAVMVSGTGRLLQHFYDAIDKGSLDAQINTVICSKHCNAEKIARARNAAVIVVPGSLHKEVFRGVMKEYKIDIIVLAGYIKKVNLPSEYRGKCLNIHPSLLPKYGGKGMYGDRIHKSVIEANEKETGCTVHFVNEEYDSGPIILQKKCKVLPNDDFRSLADRVFEQEKIAYIEALSRFCL